MYYLGHRNTFYAVLSLQFMPLLCIGWNKWTCNFRCYPAFIHGCMFNTPISLLPETHIFFRPCTFRHVRSVFMAILTYLTIIDYSWQQGIGFEHFKDSFYDRHRIFPTVQKCREEKDIVLQNDGKIFAFSFALFKMFIPSLMQMTHCWGASAVCINITVLSNEDVKMSIISL